MAVQLWFFMAQATYISLISLLLFVLVFGGFALVTDLLRRDQQRRAIKSAFAYLSPDLVRQISRNPDQLKLGGERKEISVLFADLRDFTAVSETFKDDPDPQRHPDAADGDRSRPQGDGRQVHGRLSDGLLERPA